ncbi:unnamed protein product, partial [marine sediment metagenome]
EKGRDRAMDWLAFIANIINRVPIEKATSET